MHIKSSHQIHLEMIERTLEPASCFQLHAARHRALVTRGAIAEDKEYCDALLLKIEHLLNETVVAPVTSTATTASASTSEEVESARDAA